MKKLGIIGVGVALVLLCLVGSEGSVAQASADFFGICLLDESKPLESLWDVTRNENGGVSYRHNSSLADPRIHCWGYINEPGTMEGIVLPIVNNSKRPIEMNYLADSYQLITYDKSLYKLKILTPITKLPRRD